MKSVPVMGFKQKVCLNCNFKLRGLLFNRGNCICRNCSIPRLMPLLIDSGDRDSSDGPGFVRIEAYLFPWYCLLMGKFYAISKCYLSTVFEWPASRTFLCDNGIRFRYNRDLKVKAAFGCNQNGRFKGANGHYNQMAISEDWTPFGCQFATNLNGR